MPALAAVRPATLPAIKPAFTTLRFVRLSVIPSSELLTVSRRRSGSLFLFKNLISPLLVDERHW
jgi:hypothetical protein